MQVALTQLGVKTAAAAAEGIQGRAWIPCWAGGGGGGCDGTAGSSGSDIRDCTTPQSASLLQQPLCMLSHLANGRPQLLPLGPARRQLPHDLLQPRLVRRRVQLVHEHHGRRLHPG